MAPIWGHTAKGCIFPECSQLEWKQIVSFSCGFRCFYCGQNITPTTATKDHLVPVSKGGCLCCGNLVAACNRCNCMKRNKTVYEFLKMKPALVETTGEFYTSISCLKPICEVDTDPLLNAVRRLACKKRFPDLARYQELERKTSVYWRSPESFWKE